MAAAPSSPATNLQRLEALEARERELEARVAQLERVITGFAAVLGGGSAGGAQEAASDRELDAPNGDPDVKFVPNSFADKTMKGRKFSRCSVDFLEVLAETYDFFAQKNASTGEKTTGGRPKADFDRKSARLARGWARRLRDGWTPPPPPPRPTFGSGGAAPPAAAGGGFGGSGGGFGNGSRGFMGGAPPAAPAPTPDEAGPDADIDFEFGANVGAAAPPAPPPPRPEPAPVSPTAPTTTDPEDFDDAPL